MLQKSNNSVTVICDECGQIFETDGRESDRARWRAEGWFGIDGSHYCGDCGVSALPLKTVQNELRNPRPETSSSWIRRMALWKRLDQLMAQ